MILIVAKRSKWLNQMARRTQKKHSRYMAVSHRRGIKSWTLAICREHKEILGPLNPKLSTIWGYSENIHMVVSHHCRIPSRLTCPFVGCKIPIATRMMILASVHFGMKARYKLERLCLNPKPKWAFKDPDLEVGVQG